MTMDITNVAQFHSVSWVQATNDQIYQGSVYEYSQMVVESDAIFFSSQDNHLLVDFILIAKDWELCASSLSIATDRNFTAEECENQLVYLIHNLTTIADPVLKNKLLKMNQEKAEEMQCAVSTEETLDQTEQPTPELEAVYEEIREIFCEEDTQPELEAVYEEIREIFQKEDTLVDVEMHCDAPVEVASAQTTSLQEREIKFVMTTTESAYFRWTPGANIFFLDLLIAGNTYAQCANKLKESYHRKFKAGQCAAHYARLIRSKKSINPILRSKMQEFQRKNLESNVVWTEQWDSRLQELYVSGESARKCADALSISELECKKRLAFLRSKGLLIY